METLERLAGKLARDLNRLDSTGSRSEDAAEISASLVTQLADQLAAVRDGRWADSGARRRDRQG